MTSKRTTQADQADNSQAAAGDAAPQTAAQDKPAAPKAKDQQVPSIGRIVLFRSDNSGLCGNGGAEEAPAIITRVLGSTRVNLQVFRDCAEAVPVRDVELKEQLEEPCDGNYWRWPPRA